MKVNQHGYVIRLSENALIQMVLNGLEAYSIYHRQKGRHKTGLETYGLLWGHHVTLPDRRTLLSIELVSVDTSAIMEKTSCIPSESALILKRDIMTSFWPHCDFLGDFHTHSHKQSHTSIIRDRLYEFSDIDRRSVEEWSEYWLQHNYRAGIALSITSLKKKSSRRHKWINATTIDFTMGNYRMWLKGYVAHEEKKGTLSFSDNNLFLDCPALVGLVDEYTLFGKGTERQRKERHKKGDI